MTGGREDKAKSRRVVFRVDYDLEDVIDAIKKDVEEAEPPGGDLGDGKRQVFETGDPATVTPRALR